MEKSEKLDTLDTDSMRTVTVKDFESHVDYQEPPPAYRSLQHSTRVQMTKIIATAAVLMCGMLSAAIVVSAWISTTATCQSQQGIINNNNPLVEPFLQPEQLKGLFGLPLNKDLELSESNNLLDGKRMEGLERIMKTVGSKNNDKDSNKEGLSLSSSEEEGEEDDPSSRTVTMLRLPLELSLQEPFFETNKKKSEMKCVIEKTRAQGRTNNNATNKEGQIKEERMAISCGNGNDRMEEDDNGMRMSAPPPLPPRRPLPLLPFALREILNSALAAAASAPVHVIGPIPLLRQRPPEHIPRPPLPFRIFSEMMERNEPSGPSSVQVEEGPSEIPSHLIPIIMPAEDVEVDIPSGPGPILLDPSTEGLRGERALLNPVPIMPRNSQPHFQHLIRPRRSLKDEQSVVKNRVKRCSCDCACK